MAYVNLLKQVKIDDRWVLRSIPKKANGQGDWSALPDGNYFIEFREKGKRRRLPAGATVAQALEVQRRKHAELEALAFGIIAPRPSTEDLPKPVLIDGLIDRYLDQIETLKKPNTFRKYNAVLRRFAKHFAGKTLDAVSVEDLNDFIVTLKKGGMSPNTVLHNVIIIAQFCKRNGRSGITRQVHLPERISSHVPLPAHRRSVPHISASPELSTAVWSADLRWSGPAPAPSQCNPRRPPS